MSEKFGAYLLGRWRPAFTGSDRFTLVGSAQSAEGVLHGDVFVAGEDVEVSLSIVDNQGNTVASDHVALESSLFPRDMIGRPEIPAPSVEPIVECREVCDSYDNVQLGNLANNGGTVFRCGSNSSFSCRHQNNYLETIDWGNRGWTSADRVRIFHKTYVAPDNYAGISINGTNLQRGNSDYGCKYNSLALICCRKIPEGCK